MTRKKTTKTKKKKITWPRRPRAVKANTLSGPSLFDVLEEADKLFRPASNCERPGPDGDDLAVVDVEDACLADVDEACIVDVEDVCPIEVEDPTWAVSDDAVPAAPAKPELPVLFRPVLFLIPE
jgi:hypothetical protein